LIKSLNAGETFKSGKAENMKFALFLLDTWVTLVICCYTVCCRITAD